MDIFLLKMLMNLAKIIDGVIGFISFTKIETRFALDVAGSIARVRRNKIQ